MFVVVVSRKEQFRLKPDRVRMSVPYRYWEVLEGDLCSAATDSDCSGREGLARTEVECCNGHEANEICSMRLSDWSATDVVAWCSSMGYAGRALAHIASCGLSGKSLVSSEKTILAWEQMLGGAAAMAAGVDAADVLENWIALEEACSETLNEVTFSAGDRVKMNTERGLEELQRDLNAKQQHYFHTNRRAACSTEFQHADKKEAVDCESFIAEMLAQGEALGEVNEATRVDVKHSRIQQQLEDFFDVVCSQLANATAPKERSCSDSEEDLESADETPLDHVDHERGSAGDDDEFDSVLDNALKQAGILGLRSELLRLMESRRVDVELTPAGATSAQPSDGAEHRADPRLALLAPELRALRDILDHM